MALITVEFVGPVRRPGKERRLTLEVEPQTSVTALLTRLGYGPEERARLTVLVDGARAAATAAVDDGTTVEILLPVGGG